VLIGMQKAVRDGKFATVAGRGAPIARSADEGNPFIAREEFLLNRMVQRQGAAPPWVELQRGGFLDIDQ
jgi:DnaJ family protein C protein 28